MAHWDATLDAAEWVTLAEAAAAAGVSVSALRTWYRRGDVASELAAGPHGQQRLVRLEDVLERAARSRPAVDRPRAGGATADIDDTSAGATVALLAQQLERAEHRAERTEAALRDAIARAAAAEAERDLLRRLLEQRD
jgi:transposase